MMSGRFPHPLLFKLGLLSFYFQRLAILFILNVIEKQKGVEVRNRATNQLIALGECTCTYCKSLWIGASVKCNATLLCSALGLWFSSCFQSLKKWLRKKGLKFFVVVASLILDVDSTILYYTLLYSTILYYILLYSTILYYTLLYSTTLYCTLLYSTIQIGRASCRERVSSPV